MAAKKSSKKTAPEALSFEDSMKSLGSIVESLEGGELSLEESLTEFERGVRLVKAAQTKLDSAESKVEELLAVNGEGEAETAALQIDDE